MIKADPLDILFVKGDEVNRELLRDILTPYVRLDEKGRIFPLSPLYKKSNKDRVLILLLARKAITLKTSAEEAISPKELSRLTDMPEGSLRPTLRMLVEEKILDDENSKYKVFSHALQRCAEILSKRSDDISIIPENQTRQYRQKISMKSVIEDLLRQGGLDEGKTAREIHQLVVQRRPGTKYNALYKVIVDLFHEQKIYRDIKGGTWVYRRKE